MERENNFWYNIGADIPSNNLKSHELGILVDREYVESLKNLPKEDKERFVKVFNENVEEFKEYFGKDFKLQGDLYEEEFPWLWGFDFYRWGFQLDRDDDTKDSRYYFSHNCDSLGQRGIVITAFNIWAKLVEAFHNKI